MPHNPAPIVLVLLVLFLGAGSAALAEPERAFAIVHPLGERPVGGRVVGVSAGGVVIAPASGERQTFALDAVREVRFPEPQMPDNMETPHRLTLVGGEILLGQVLAPTDEGFTFDVPDIGRVRISFDVLRSLEVRDGRRDVCDDLADKHGPAASGDIAHLKGSGDKFTGTLLSADDERLVIENQRGRKRQVAWNELLVLHLENPPVPASSGVTVEIEFGSGTRAFCASPPTLDDATLRFALRSAPDVELAAPFANVRALRFTGGRFDYASDLPFESEFQPYYPVPTGMSFGDLEGRKRFWGARKDRRPSGCPLRLGGATYRYGFAVHSKSVVTLSIDGRYRSFEAAFGIDDEVKRSGTTEAEAARVDARVVADGKVIWEQKNVTLEDTPHKVGPVDVSGVKVLELIVDFGQDSGPVGDDAAWVNPILVKN